MPPGLAALRRAEMLTERIHGLPSRAEVAAVTTVTPVLGQLITLRRRPTELVGDPDIVRLDAKGRFDLAGVGARLGWTAGDLQVSEYEGHGWIVLTATGLDTRRRHTARVNRHGRVTVPAAIWRTLGLGPGAKAFVLELPASGRLAVTNPAHILTGAPLPDLEPGADHTDDTTQEKLR